MRLWIGLAARRQSSLVQYPTSSSPGISRFAVFDPVATRNDLASISAGTFSFPTASSASRCGPVKRPFAL